MILWWVRFYNDFEGSNFQDFLVCGRRLIFTLVGANSLERIQQYVTIEQEDQSADMPPAYWPASGDLRVENLNASYSPVRFKP